MTRFNTVELAHATRETGSAESATSRREDRARRVYCATYRRPGLPLFVLAEPEWHGSFLAAQSLRRLMAAARFSLIETRVCPEALLGCHTPIDDGCVHDRPYLAGPERGTPLAVWVRESFASRRGAG